MARSGLARALGQGGVVNTLLALPNVSASCVTTNPCTCPIYGPGGVYNPVLGPDGPYCALALEVGPVVAATPVPTLSTWASILTVVLLVAIGLRGLRR